jgi:hypothetical protein
MGVGSANTVTNNAKSNTPRIMLVSFPRATSSGRPRRQTAAGNYFFENKIQTVTVGLETSLNQSDDIF